MNVVLLPVYRPEDHLLTLARGLSAADEVHAIVVVDDGGGEEAMPFLASVAGLGCTVLRHPVNRGKGAALKTGFRHIAEAYPGQDRKSTRLNSSHANISYAVFCLKKNNSSGLKR